MFSFENVVLEMLLSIDGNREASIFFEVSSRESVVLDLLEDILSITFAGLWASGIVGGCWLLFLSVAPRIASVVVVENGLE